MNKGYIYIIEIDGYFKIGRTKDIKKRLVSIKTSNANKEKVVLLLEVPYYKSAEKLLHFKFRRKRIKGEWFSLTKEDIEDIRNILINFKY